jgi:hypothetical protein
MPFLCFTFFYSNISGSRKGILSSLKNTHTQNVSTLLMSRKVLFVFLSLKSRLPTFYIVFFITQPFFFFDYIFHSVSSLLKKEWREVTHNAQMKYTKTH